MPDVDKVEYTPPALAFPVKEGLVRACRETFAGSLRAVVLTGSLARNEASYVNRDGRALLQSDVEAMVVVHDDASLPSRATQLALCRLAEQYLAESGVAVEVSFSVVHAGYLRSLPPYIYSYELRSCGVVLFGDADVLLLIPNYATSELSREDAWRMLANRLIEYTAVAYDPAQQRLARYRALKLCLDLASSLLVFFNRFEAGYRARLHRMEDAATLPAIAEVPIAMAEFMPLLRRATACKLDAATEDDLGADFNARVCRWAWQLWEWELRTMTSDFAAPDVPGLLHAFGLRCGKRRLLRGWAYATRRVGWLASAPYWFKWLALFRRRLTPRHAIYLAAYQWHLACEPGAVDNGDEPLGAVRRLLPVCRAGAQQCDALAEALLTNYKEFVVETRA